MGSSEGSPECGIVSSWTFVPLHWHVPSDSQSSCARLGHLPIHTVLWRQQTTMRERHQRDDPPSRLGTISAPSMMHSTTRPRSYVLVPPPRPQTTLRGRGARYVRVQSARLSPQWSRPPC